MVQTKGLQTATCGPETTQPPILVSKGLLKLSHAICIANDCSRTTTAELSSSRRDILASKGTNI